MNLIPEWRTWRRMWSMRWLIAGAFLSAIPTAYTVMPEDWLPAIPQWIKAALAIATMFSFGAAGVSRLLVQPPPKAPTSFDGGQT